MDSMNNPQTPGRYAGQMGNGWPGGPVPATTPAQPGWQAGQGGSAQPGWQAASVPPGAPAGPGWQSASYGGESLPATPLGTTPIGPKVSWAALPTISKWFRITAWVVAIGGGLGFVVCIIEALAASSAAASASASSGYYSGSSMSGLATGSLVATAFICLIMGTLGFLYNLAIAEVIGVFLAIEKNTRQE
jgi:hypothetical protein